MKISVEQFQNDPLGRQDQPRELRRVKKDIAIYVMEFSREQVGHLFHIQEMESYISRFKRIAPGSGARILRKLRDEGYIEYRVINRRESAYMISWIKIPGTEADEKS